ncbi:10847_t:CDS:2, partial [Acaulospora colombiana]
MDSDRRSGFPQQYDSYSPTNIRSAASPTQGRQSRELLTESRSRADDFNPEHGWDVYADFNNTGPRYSAVKTTPDGYQSIPSPAAASSRPVPSGATSNGRDLENGVELVTVPALGAEWKADELKAMTKKGRKEEQEYTRNERLKAWWRDQYGLCGGWGTRRAIVWTVFIACIITGIILAFTIPRAPGIIYNKDTPLGPSPYEDDEPKFSSGLPVLFQFNATLDVHINTGENFLPLRFKHLRAEVADLDTQQLIATGDLGSYVLPAKAYERVAVPVFFNYTAANNTDQTWAN